MTSSKILLDTSAILDLRKSVRIDAFDNSLFLFASKKKEQRNADRFRRWLELQEKQGAVICITPGAIMESNNNYNQMVNRIAAHLSGRKATVKLMLKNNSYRNNLYDYAENCIRCDKEEFRKVIKIVLDAYSRWRTDQTIDCVTKHNLRNKNYDPEFEDIKRLSEAIVNTKKRTIEVLFMTSDGHFLCHEISMVSEFGIQVINHQKIS